VDALRAVPRTADPPRRWSPAGHGLLTVVVALLLVTAVLIW